MKNKSLLLVNLGTPESPEPREVGRYLREFLMDKYVLSIPFFFRWVLVNIIIVPLRSFKSSKNYKKVWTDEGSPLLFHTERLTKIVSDYKKEYENVAFAMRYGRPSIKKVLASFKEGSEVDLIPLYPHETQSSVGTAVERVKELAKKRKLKINVLPVFYAEKFYLRNMSEHIKNQLVGEDISKKHFVFSFHGIPKSHLKGVCPTMNSSEKPGCCDTLNSLNKDCYRAQCFESSRLLSNDLGLDSKNITVVFQSRVGRAEWISPNIDEEMKRIAETGKKEIVIISPSFVADCLETLEELAMGVREDYEAVLPGSEVKVLTCLNNRAEFAKDLADWSYNFKAD